MKGDCLQLFEGVSDGEVMALDWARNVVHGIPPRPWVDGCARLETDPCSVVFLCPPHVDMAMDSPSRSSNTPPWDSEFLCVNATGTCKC